MINLEEHIVEIDGKQYIPYHIAVQAVHKISENTKEVDNAINIIKDPMKNLSNLNIDNEND